LKARTLIGILTLVLSACTSSSPSSDRPTGEALSEAPHTGRSFYVSLGDSLAAGFQPGQGRTREGYVDQLWRGIRETIPSLVVRKFGCPGETSRSLVTGVHSPCKHPAGSQLADAVAFLKKLGDHVSFITIDVGANDLVDGCFDFEGTGFDRSCARDVVPGVGDRVARIVDALRYALGRDVPILGMTYHDPFLGLWGHVPHGKALARGARDVFDLFNAELTRSYAGAGATVADVATTFRVDDFSRSDTGGVPVNVATACRWTWFCSKKYFGDPHANATGYGKIAETFGRELGPLLP
jgi:lysophospholipase L1-like esterase